MVLKICCWLPYYILHTFKAPVGKLSPCTVSQYWHVICIYFFRSFKTMTHLGYCCLLNICMNIILKCFLNSISRFPFTPKWVTFENTLWPLISSERLWFYYILYMYAKVILYCIDKCISSCHRSLYKWLLET